MVWTRKTSIPLIVHDIGAIGDAHGIRNAMRFQAVAAAGTIVLAWFLPTEARIRELTAWPVVDGASAPAKAAAVAGGEGD